jgi:cytochrome b involved in lipid metabolism
MLRKTAVTLVAFTGSLILLAGCSAKPAPQPQETSQTPTESALPATTNPTSSPTTMDATKTYMMSEVAVHNTATDCWTTIDGGVYNVTEFVAKHPGGAAIIKACGKDATTMIKAVEKHQENMTNIQSLLQTMKIGTLAE